MSGCDDPLAYLKQFGYSVMQHPKVRVMPLGLLVRAKGPATWQGSVQNFLECSSDPPPYFTPTSQIKIKGEVWSSLNVDIGLKILANVLSLFGKGLGLSFGYEQARKVKFTFEDVKEVSIEPGVVARFLDSCPVPRDSIIYDWVDPSEYEAFVITGVLRSNSISIEAEDKEGHKIEVDVPAISDAVSLGVKVEYKTGSKTWVEYKGTERRTFGFRCHQVWVWQDKERLRMKPLQEPADGIFAEAIAVGLRPEVEKQEFVPFVLGPGEMYDLEIID